MNMFTAIFVSEQIFVNPVHNHIIQVYAGTRMLYYISVLYVCNKNDIL